MAVARKKKQEEKQETMNYYVKVKRATEFKSGDIGIDLEVNGVALYGSTYVTRKVDGEEKSFISFPARKGSDGKYYKYSYFPISEELLANIEEQIEEVLS